MKMTERELGRLIGQTTLFFIVCVVLDLLFERQPHLSHNVVTAILLSILCELLRKAMRPASSN